MWDAMRFRSLLTACAALLWLGMPAGAAECVGRNLFDDLPSATLGRMHAATAAVPFHRGLFWQASKGDQRITLIGTYHFDDPRHAATLARFGPVIDAAAALMVEAGPDEEARLAAAMGQDPTLLFDPVGPTLPERLDAQEWDLLSQALAARGMPAVVSSRMRPWYVSMMLGISPCMINAMRENGDTGGLDHQLIVRAQAGGVPVAALEPWDTLFSLFRDMPAQDEIDMIRAAMPAAAYADDYTVTLTDAYFSGDSWLLWEFGREDAYARSGLSKAKVDTQFQMAQTRLMDQRNAQWIAPLEAAAAKAATQGKGIVAGFGALHLPGRRGVLSLLQNAGWTITPLTLEGGQNGG